MKTFMQAFIVPKQEAMRLADANPDGILIFNPSFVLSKEQAVFAAILAQKAMELGQNIANKLAIEFLVRLSGERKIQSALQFGPQTIEDAAGIVILDDSIDTHEMHEVDHNPNMEIICGKYAVSIDTAKEEIYEKMAMVDV